MTKLYEVTLAVLCVWRFTHLFTAEDGPWDLIVRLRSAAGSGVLGRLIDCFYCLSLWISIPFACSIGGSWRERLLLWPALSAAAIFIERLTGFREPLPTGAVYFEDKEKSECRAAETDESLSSEAIRPEPPSGVTFSVTSGGQH